MSNHASTSWDRRAFGLALRSRREAMGVSLRQVEKDTGLSFATVNRIESATLAGTMDSVAILARWAGLSLNPFMLLDVPKAEEVNPTEAYL